MDGDAPAITCSNIECAFEQQVLFKNLHLKLPVRQITALVGASGCGKSSLLNLMNGLLQPDAGQVRIFGEPLDYTRLPETRRGMGYAVQQIGLMPHMTVERNITLLARLAGWSEAERTERLETLMALMALDPALATRYPHQISGGQAQRVGLCRAMMLNPPILLLDEAFSAVDPITRVDVHARFQTLQRDEPRTVVMVTHDMREAMKLADHLVVMGPGEILQTGAPDGIAARPAGDQVKRLMEVDA
ncbi:ATP-binding cassette domain-containing protein [Larsenimonas salina]|uniref:ATP-binding cassette domain-containing protein n=1 Tax=Larsenimonas salina TaxID=1295565 RepID=UPI00207303AE|nr:ATP-binding cassette domain-containing protein [Larsenimonas salina]MCM5703312.1 ATP-binding cassette domain-containing protein [Larsenimonas salina]